jgi:hypothetical protein
MVRRRVRRRPREALSLIVFAACKCNAWISRNLEAFVQPCLLTMWLIQMGAKGDVQPFETG